MLDAGAISQIVLLEDTEEQAHSLIERLKVEDIITDVEFLSSLRELKALLGAKKKIERFYIVDIHLGVGKANDGIKAIKLIRKSDPDGFILVYSAHPDKEHESLEAGADLFFKKDPVSLEDDLIKIRNTLKRLFVIEEKYLSKNLPSKLDEHTETTVFSQIVDVDVESDVVRLMCKLEENSDEFFERVFPLVSFKHLREENKLMPGTSVLVKILEGPGKVCFNFEEGQRDYFPVAEDIDIEDMVDSDVFKPM